MRDPANSQAIETLAWNPPARAASTGRAPHAFSLISVIRLLTCILLVTLASCARAADGAPASSVNPNTTAPGGLTPAEEAELAALLAAQRGWERSLALRASAGWRDNILLSAFAPISRGFGRAELDAFVWRPMHNAWETIAYLNGDVLRYFSPGPDTEGEQQWLGHGEVRWQPLEAARLALKADGFFHDAVIDLSTTQGIPEAVQTKTHGGFATLVARFTLPRGFAFEPIGQLKRTDFREFAGDYDETVGGARLEWRHSDALRVSVGGVERDRRYKQRVEYTAGGRALPNTRLRFRQREGDVKLASTFQAGGRWTTSIGAGYLENRDRASGYFDYNQKRASLAIAWERAQWTISLDGDARRMDYLVQTVGAGIAPPPRIADLFEAELRVERELNARWTLFAEYAWERDRSNEPEFNYRANTALAGVQRTF